MVLEHQTDEVKHLCGAQGSAKTMQWLYDNGAQDDIRTPTIDGTTCQENNVEAMQWLFDHGAQDDVRTPNNQGRTPMICAWKIEAMQWLFDHGAQEDVRTPTYFIAGRPASAGMPFGAVARGDGAV